MVVFNIVISYLLTHWL